MCDESKWPQNIGILGIETYIPNFYVIQTELETYDGVSAGKYTIGLGQEKMGFCNDREDINSMCLTVLTKLLKTYNIDPKQVGRLDVGTETILDKSKSVKSVLMQLFENSNTEIDGLDTLNACYGGTAALFNAINWIESSSWDGRLAIVVTGDIAVYAQGNARPTGGAGVVALLVGPGAPLVFERGLRSIHMQHVYDFYKPDMNSEYPTVDGKLSVQCYFNALDVCYQNYCKKAEKSKLTDKGQNYFSLNSINYMLFHTPYCRLVEKSFARLHLNDVVRISNYSESSAVSQYRNVKLQDTYFDKDLEKVLLTSSLESFMKKTQKSLYVAKNVGNMYTSSLYGGLASLILSYDVDSLLGARVGMFSYGSGLASSMFSLKIVDSDLPKYSLEVMRRNLLPLLDILKERHLSTPAEFSKILKEREQIIHKAPYSPVGDIKALRPGTWYLESVDDKYRRVYQQVPGGMSNGDRAS